MRARPQVFVGGKFVGGSDATIKLLDEGQLLEQGDAAGSALPSDLQQAVDKANKEFEACCLAHDLTIVQDCSPPGPPLPAGTWEGSRA